MPYSVELKDNTSPLDNGAYQPNWIFQKGQKILYEGKEAEVISINPILVIKTRDRVVCGNIQKRIRCVQ